MNFSCSKACSKPSLVTLITLCNAAFKIVAFSRSIKPTDPIIEEQDTGTSALTLPSQVLEQTILGHFKEEKRQLLRLPLLLLAKRPKSHVILLRPVQSMVVHHIRSRHAKAYVSERVATKSLGQAV